MHHDFEDGTTQGWFRRGTAILAVTNEAAATGLNSLKVTGRTASWNGPGLNVMPEVQKDLLYQFRVSVRLAAGQATTQDTLRMTMERRVAGETADRFDSIASSATGGVTSGGWVTLQGSYRLTTDVTKLIVYVATAATASFYIDDVALSYAPPLPVQTDIPSLKDVLADSFTIGAAVDVGEIASARHTDLTRKHFDTITGRHSWKFGPIHPTEATYNFGPADTIANFGRLSGLKVRGHTLVWHQQNPDWLFRDEGGVDLTPTPENKELVLQRLESHIRTVVPRYADVVTSWDVVNEVIDPNQPDGLRRSRWFELTGTGLHRPRLRGRARRRGTVGQALHQRLQHDRDVQTAGAPGRGAGHDRPWRSRRLRGPPDAHQRRESLGGGHSHHHRDLRRPRPGQPDHRDGHQA